MILREPNGQQLLNLSEPKCSRCRNGALGRCRGPSTVESFVEVDDEWIGCLDSSRQTQYFANLSRWRPPPVLDPPSVPELPPFIPQLKITMPCRPPPGRIYALSFSAVLTPTGGISYRGNPRRLRRALKLPNGAPILGLATGKDLRIEDFWRRSEREGLWEELASLDFAASTSGTYSVWDQQPRADQIYSQERNLASYDRLAALGVPTIPFLFCYAPEDYEAAARWLGERPGVRVVAQSAQHYEREQDFAIFMDRLCRFRDVAPRPLHYLIVGAATADKIRRLFAELPSVTIVTGRPVHEALSGLRATEDLEFVPDPAQKAQLLRSNIDTYDRFCAALAEAMVSTAIPGRDHVPSEPAPAAQGWSLDGVIEDNVGDPDRQRPV